MRTGTGALVLFISLGTVSIASAQFPTTLTVRTDATFINSAHPSSTTTSFSVTRQNTFVATRNGVTFRQCTIGGTPVVAVTSHGATAVGNCQWNIFTQGGLSFLRFSFNFRLPGTSGHWGQFNLINTNDIGRFSRFHRPGSFGIGAANGPVAVLGGTAPPPPPSGFPDVAGRWLVDAFFVGETCSFSEPSDFPNRTRETVTVTQTGGSITMRGSAVWIGEVEPNGDFIVVRVVSTETVGSCTVRLVDGLLGNFVTGLVNVVVLVERVSGNCTALGPLPCGVVYNGTIRFVSALSLDDDLSSSTEVGGADISDMVDTTYDVWDVMVDALRSE